MSMTAEKTISSIFPEHEQRQIPIGKAAYLLSEEIDRSRTRENYSFEQAVETFLAKHGVAIPRQDTAKAWADELRVLIRADKVHDSERAQAERAALKVLGWRFPFGRVPMIGWIRGLSVKLPGGRFTLTGSACRGCGVNPEAYGVGGGVRCVDTQNCGWWFCY